MKEFFLFTLIIVVHEMGHIASSLYYKWHIKEVIILPFGGLTLFEEQLNRPIKEEFYILLWGPLTQIIFYYLALFLGQPSELFHMYHFLILGFNLMPVLPLDGAKLIELLLERYFPYQVAVNVSIFISILTFILLCLVGLQYRISFVYFVILLFLILQVIRTYKMRKNVFYKFLLERYLYQFHFKRWKKIQGENVEKMYRDCGHVFLHEKKYQTERETLSKRFDFKGKLW